jgi:hypothetical protein
MIANELKLKDGQLPLEVFKGKPQEEVIEIMSRNVHRRHLTDDQRVAKLLGDTLSKEAQDRKQSKLKTGGKFPVVSESTRRERTWEKIASEAKVGQHKARAALDVVKHAPKGIIEEVIAGKKRLRQARPKRQSRKKRELTFEQEVMSRFQRWMDYWSPTRHREVRAIIREFVGPKT